MGVFFVQFDSCFFVLFLSRFFVENVLWIHFVVECLSGRFRWVGEVVGFAGKVT